MSDYWQLATKVKKINQISSPLPLAGCRNSRMTEGMLDIGRLPSNVQSLPSHRNPQDVYFDSHRLNAIAMRVPPPQII